jgi:hypothetical protein
MKTAALAPAIAPLSVLLFLKALRTAVDLPIKQLHNFLGRSQVSTLGMNKPFLFWSAGQWRPRPGTAGEVGQGTAVLVCFWGKLFAFLLNKVCMAGLVVAGSPQILTKQVWWVRSPTKPGRPGSICLSGTAGPLNGAFAEAAQGTFPAAPTLPATGSESRIVPPQALPSCDILALTIVCRKRPLCVADISADRAT